MTNKEKIKKIKLNLFDMAIGDIIRAIRGGSLIGAFILSFCLIDYLAGIFYKAQKRYYKVIIREYFENYDVDYMYAIRCSLVHIYGRADALGNDSFFFQHKNPENHKRISFTTNGNRVYLLNLSNFVFDTIKASYNFFNDLENKSESELQEYIVRAEKIILIRNIKTGEIISKSNFSSLDSIFVSLDQKKVNWEILKNEIDKLCFSK